MSASTFGRKRVVITGMGTVNPLGNSVSQTWDAILAGRSGITGITRFDSSRLNTRIAGEVKGLDYTRFFQGDMLKKARRMDRFCHYAAAALAEAAEQSGISQISAKERIGVAVGSGIGGIEIQHQNSIAHATQGNRRVSPFYIPMSIGNMASGILSMIYGFVGPNLSLQTACATANHAIATALMIIRSGMADVMVAGGTEASITELTVAGFSNMRALSCRNDSPQTASRPYDRDRDGFVLSEGCAILVLEEYEHAKRRGADIVCEVLSCGMSGDAYDFVAPEPEGRGAYLAMKMALDQGGMPLDRVGYINAHGTSTLPGDVAEIRGVYRLLASTKKRVHVGSTKSYHGHLLGATAGLEAIITALAVREDVVPANINLFNPDPDLPDVSLPTEILEAPIGAAISNSFGFGGHNSSLLLGKL